MRNTILRAALVLLLAVPAAAQQRIASVEGITEYRLANGLRVLLFPDQSKPTVTVNITYLVGSAQEGYGETGMAHLLEHLQFKGSKGHTNIPQELTERGARTNATTWLDRTNFFETLQATDANLQWALGLEADRMVNSFIARKDLDSEMTVVRNEFERGENDPSSVLEERVLSTAFLWHNYGHSTIGARSDIENVPIDRLQAFYRRFYQPDNAVLLVAGRFDEPKTLATIQSLFGAIAKPDRELPKVYTQEPTQDGERIVRLRRVGDSKVVILGESGTGKGVLARRIHEQSRRRQKAFLDVHCAAMAHELLESELFGHERGAFTGAVAEKPGLFEFAEGGTLFLDEFAEMSPEMQSKLLKVLDHGELRRVGGVRTITVDVRVIVATNRDVDELVRTGQLREDLLHRLDVLRITLPPLRERPEDIPRLATHFLALHQGRGLGEKTLTPQAMRVLQGYGWPGNVRELANTIERLLILSPRPTIEVDDLPENLRFRKPLAAMTDERNLSLAEVERRHILRVLETTGGNLTAAAKRLGIDRNTLRSRMQQWQGHGARMGSA